MALQLPQSASSPAEAMPEIREDAVTVLFDNTNSEGPNLDLVFIHGLNGHPQRTWMHGSGFYWPWALRTELKSSRVMTFGYNAGVRSKLAENLVRIKGVAATLNGRLANRRTTREELSRPLVFIGHSMGGLVAKAAAIAASSAQVTQANDLDKLYTSIRGFVFFGTPHWGSAALAKTRVRVFQNMATAVFAGIPPKLEQALKLGSDELLDLADEFRKISLYVEGRLMIASYYEQLMTLGLGDRVVDESSAFIHYSKANDPEPINADHVNMVKFSGEQDGNYENIRGLLVRWETRLTEPAASKENIKSQIPIPRAAELFGRHRELDDIHRFLGTRGATRKGVVIWGVSGYGKTQLAIHYIHKFHMLYSSVLWIDASTKDSLEDSFQEIAFQLQTPDARPKTAINYVKNWLSRDTNKPWLMAFDNVNIMEDLDIRHYLPDCGHGSFIITTTRSDLHSSLNFCDIELKGVDDLAGSKILLKSLGDDLSDQSKTVATAIARKLKGIPLAIEQASAFLSFGIVKIDEYNNHFQEYLDDTLKVLPRDSSSSYEKSCTIYAALDMVHQALQLRHPDSVKLLNLSVLLGPGEVPFALLAQAPLAEDSFGFSSNQGLSPGDAKYLSDIRAWLLQLRNKARDFGVAIQKLEQACLMKFNRDPDCQIRSYLIHEMIRDWVLRRLSNEEISEYAITAFALTGAILYNQSGLCSPQIMQKHVARLNAVLEMVSTTVSEEAIKVPEGKYASLYGAVAFGFGKFCSLQGQLDKAKELLTAAIEYRTISEGKTWPVKQEHLAELEELAVVEWRLGNLEEATKRYSSLLDECMRILGEDADMTITVATSLREVRERQARIDHARERAYTASRNPKSDYHVSSEPPQYQDIDDEEWGLRIGYDEAKNLFGENDIETLQRAGKLAAYYRKFARLHDEEPVLEFMLKGYERTLGSGHTLTLDTVQNLAICYLSQGKLAEGEQVYVEGIEKALCVKPTLTETGHTPLHIASGLGHKMIVKLLLENGASVSAVNEGRSTPLHVASCRGHLGVVNRLLEAKADATAQSNDGWTPLHVAAQNGFSKVVCCLLQAGVDANSAAILDITPLHLAVYRGHEDTAEQLIQLGGNPLLVDGFGRSSLDWAFSYDPLFQKMGDSRRSYVRTPESEHLKRLRRSVHFLSQNLTSSSGPRQLFDWLGRCLIHLECLNEACTAFEQNILEISDKRKIEQYYLCNSCDTYKKREGERFVCMQCPETDLCGQCMEKYKTGSSTQGRCQVHEFLRVPGRNWHRISPPHVNLLGETRDKWLKRIGKEFGDPDTYSYSLLRTLLFFFFPLELAKH